MIIKFIFILLWGTAGAYVGILLKKRLSVKKNYFTDVFEFCENFKHNLTYKQNKLKDFADEFDYTSIDFKKDFNCFLQSGNSNITLLSTLNEEEKCEIKKLFDSLGNVDIQTQLSLIEERKCIMEKFNKKYKEKVDKEGKLYIKLGLLFGLCVGVLLV